MRYILFLFFTFFIIQLSGQCIERYAVLSTYDPAKETICYERYLISTVPPTRPIKWSDSKIYLFDPNQYTGDISTTPLKPTVKYIISEKQYKEIVEYYDIYKSGAKGTDDDGAISYDMYKMLVNAIINEK